ncbi:MAG: glycosyltransferase family 2 protein [Acidobacteria bacterium]|nr:glycosyltransferase family 2 protein [Acidobacteriota bacterium]
MPSSPRITCVVPTYRRPRMLARAIRSVLNQSVEDLRVLVSDNASGDGTAEVVRSLCESDFRVSYRCQPANVGMHANFRDAMSRVDTPFYSLLSDDDVLLPDFYRTALDAFETYPGAVLVALEVPCVTQDGRVHDEPLSAWDRSGLFAPPEGAHRVAGISHPTVTGILFRSEFLGTSCALMKPEIHAADYEIILEAALNHPIVTVKRPGALFVWHRGPRALPPDPFHPVDYFLGHIHRAEEDERFPEEVRANVRKRWSRFLSGYLGDLAIRLSLLGNRADAQKALSLLAREIGRPGRARALGAFRRFSRCLPAPPRRLLLAGYDALTRWVYWGSFHAPRVNRGYREALRLD